MEKDASRWEKEEREDVYVKLGLKVYKKFFGMGSNSGRREMKWKLQKNELHQLLMSTGNDVMMTDLEYDGHGRAKVAGYTVKEEFEYMTKTGG